MKHTGQRSTSTGISLRQNQQNLYPGLDGSGGSGGLRKKLSTIIIIPATVNANPNGNRTISRNKPNRKTINPATSIPIHIHDTVKS